MVGQHFTRRFWYTTTTVKNLRPLRRRSHDPFRCPLQSPERHRHQVQAALIADRLRTPNLQRAQALSAMSTVRAQRNAARRPRRRCVWVVVSCSASHLGADERVLSKARRTTTLFFIPRFKGKRYYKCFCAPAGPVADGFWNLSLFEYPEDYIYLFLGIFTISRKVCN